MSPSIESRVGELNDAFAKAWIDGDLDALAALFSDDAMFFPPEGETLAGRAAIRDWLEALGKADNLTIEPLRIDAVDGHVFVVGSFLQDQRVRGTLLNFRGGFVFLLAETPSGLKVHRLVSFQERKPMELPA